MCQLSNDSLVVAVESNTELTVFNQPSIGTGQTLSLSNSTEEEITDKHILQGLCEFGTSPGGGPLVFGFYYDGDLSIQCAIEIGAGGATIVSRKYF